MKKYKEFVESHENPSLSIQNFLIQLILFIINIIGKEMKNEYRQEYTIRKITESFLQMRATQYTNIPNFDSPAPDSTFMIDYNNEIKSLELQSLKDIFGTANSNQQLIDSIPVQF